MSKRVDDNKLICIHYGAPVKVEKDSCYELGVRIVEGIEKTNRKAEFIFDVLDITYFILMALVIGTGALAALGIIFSIL